MGKKKSQQPNQPQQPPRQLTVLNEEYGRTCAQLGEARYQEEAAKTRIASLISKINELAKESQLRASLDSQKAKEQGAKAQVDLPAPVVESAPSEAANG